MSLKFEINQYGSIFFLQIWDYQDFDATTKMNEFFCSRTINQLIENFEKKINSVVNEKLKFDKADEQTLIEIFGVLGQSGFRSKNFSKKN